VPRPLRQVTNQFSRDPRPCSRTTRT